MVHDPSKTQADACKIDIIGHLGDSLFGVSAEAVINMVRIALELLPVFDSSKKKGVRGQAAVHGHAL